MKIRIGEDEFMKLLQERIKEAGSRRRFAKLHNFSSTFVTLVIGGKREVTERLAATIGFQKVIIYRKIEKSKKEDEGSNGPSSRD